jgi:hypothetical protein
MRAIFRLREEAETVPAAKAPRGKSKSVASTVARLKAARVRKAVPAKGSK